MPLRCDFDRSYQDAKEVPCFGFPFMDATLDELWSFPISPSRCLGVCFFNFITCSADLLVVALAFLALLSLVVSSVSGD